MKFLDQARVYVRSGDGGAGCVSFRREKFIEFGGPDGGDGGRGGDVVVECAGGLNTLIDFRYQQHFKAKTGMHGMGKNRAGGRGADAVLKVPVGTQVFDEETGAMLADLTAEGERVVVAQGGNGGFGNAHFTTSTNRAPRRANPGQPGIERTLVLRLKLIADAGPRRPAQRRQVDVPRRGLGREAEDRRLSVHDAPSGPRRRADRRARLRARRHSRPDRGRARGPRPRRPLPRPCRALRRARASRRRDRRQRRRGLPHDPARARRLRRGARRRSRRSSRCPRSTPSTRRRSAKQLERLKRAMRSYGPPVADGEKRARPLLLSTATQRGVTEVLRATIAAIEAKRETPAAVPAAGLP